VLCLHGDGNGCGTAALDDLRKDTQRDLCARSRADIQAGRRLQSPDDVFGHTLCAELIDNHLRTSAAGNYRHVRRAPLKGFADQRVELANFRAESDRRKSLVEHAKDAAAEVMTEVFNELQACR
jgi:hypothetical protein